MKKKEHARYYTLNHENISYTRLDYFLENYLSVGLFAMTSIGLLIEYCWLYSKVQHY